MYVTTVITSILMKAQKTFSKKHLKIKTLNSRIISSSFIIPGPHSSAAQVADLLDHLKPLTAHQSCYYSGHMWAA